MQWKELRGIQRRALGWESPDMAQEWRWNIPLNFWIVSGSLRKGLPIVQL